MSIKNELVGSDEIRHLSRYVSRRGEKQAAKSRFATLTVFGGICELD